MAFLSSNPARCRLVLLALAALIASGCAGTRSAQKDPARGSYFIAPVFPGDSPATVAGRYGVQTDELLALNNMKDGNRRLSKGQLRVPTHARVREEPTVVQAAAAVMTSMRAAPAVQSRPASIETRSLAPLASASARSASVRTNGLDDFKPAPPTVVGSRSAEPAKEEATWYDWLMPSAPPAAGIESPNFLWPVDGKVISPFGDNPNGGRNDGINISATRGAPVRAAEAGEVSYVGNELKSYGNLILIRHDNGFITAYAHNDGVHVKRGERVERGQVIGSAGDSGDVSQVQLHFELRRGTAPVDPSPYLVAPVPVADSTERLAEVPR